MRTLIAGFVLFTAVVIACSAASAQSPAPLTNEQILAKIASLEQEISSLKAQLKAAPPVASTRPMTLAEASEEAKRTHHDWPASSNTFTNTDLKEIPGSAPAARTAAPTMPVIGEAPKLGRQDEGYWRERMRTLHAKVDDDRTNLAAATARERDLDKRLHVSVDNIAYIRDRITRATVENQWNDAVTDVSRLKAAVINDERAVRTAEEEARRADVPPAWLVRIQ